MELTSIQFVLFVLVSSAIYYIVPKKAQWTVLLASSVLFFVMSSGILTLYMLAVTVVVYVGALWLSKSLDAFEAKKATLDKTERKEAKTALKKAQKRRLTIIVLLVLGVLAVLKYCNLGVEIANAFCNIFQTEAEFEKFNMLLPIGISYYSLMAISYVVDVHRGVIKAEKNPLRVLLFVCYFPHIVEGPFDRYKDLNQQFNTYHKFNYDVFCKGLILILFGFFKKMVIADRLGITASEIFNNADKYSGSAIGIATVLYTIQLYCDFSGCIDIVSGVSNLFGIKLAINFRQPFFSTSINEFWRRWHISLGLWLKDYVYYPVALSKSFKKVDKYAKKVLKSQHLGKLVPAAYALFFVWFSNGLWHGASIKFILYGLYYYFLMMLGEFCKPLFISIKTKMNIKDENKFFKAFQVFRTFVIVNIGMLLFRSSTIEEFVGLFKKLLSSINYLTGIIEVLSVSELVVFAFLGILILFFLSVACEKNPEKSVESLIYDDSIVFRDLMIIILLLFVVLFGVYGPDFSATEFLYAGF